MKYKNILFLSLTLLLAGCGTGNEISTDIESDSLSMEDSESSILSVSESEEISSEEVCNYDLEAFFDTSILPEESTEFSKYLALKGMELSTYANRHNSSIFKENGYKVQTFNYNKNYLSEENTTLYIFAHKKIDFYGQEKDLIIYAFSGTYGGEWLSNFNLSTNQDDSSPYADGFYEAALAAYNETKDYIESLDNPLILVTGHSRGGATSNVLGHILNEKYDSRYVYAYTYATPNVYLGEKDNTIDNNIFNFLNKEDIVTKVPMEYMGFKRFGKDIYIGGNNLKSLNLENTLNQVKKLAANVDEYYNKKYSIETSGTDPNGMSVYDYVYSLVKKVLTEGFDINSSSLNEEYVDSFLPSVADSSELSSLNNYIKGLILNDLTSTVQTLLQHDLPKYTAYIKYYYDL